MSKKQVIKSRIGTTFEDCLDLDVETCAGDLNLNATELIINNSSPLYIHSKKKSVAELADHYFRRY